MTEREGFAGRWSRLKAEAREAQPVAPAPDETISAAETTHDPSAVCEIPADAPPPAQQPQNDETQPDKVELPALDTLTKDSDYRLFMRADVPDNLRKDALRKLWTADPQFAVIDITECHSIDFNDVPTFPDGLLNTIYRVGSGMVEAVEAIDRAAAEAAAQAAETQPGDLAGDDSLPSDAQKPTR